MKVKLAVQVLSKSVAIALRETGREDVIGTAVFCEMMNGFFDCTSFIMPYESPDDQRLTWLKDVFLNYLESWKKSTEAREELTLQMIDRKCFCPSKPMKA